MNALVRTHPQTRSRPLLIFCAGILKNYVSASHKAITQRFLAYFGKTRPSLRINVPHSASFSNGDTVPSSRGGPRETEVNLEINFISEEDGRESLVDLTKTLCEMRQKGKISDEDVTLDFIDAEITGKSSIAWSVHRWLI